MRKVRKDNVKIGNLDIGDKLILAPMAEITDKPFREMARKHGAGLTFTQMISARGIVKSEFRTLRKVAFSKSELPIGVQILGCEPDCIGESVKKIVKYKPSVIDLNAGCPVRKVTKLGFGVALLDEPKKLGAIVSAMKKNSDGIPVSVKFRLGNKKNNVLENAKIIENAGADYIVLHPKLGVQSSMEKPAWEWIAELKQKLKIPVVGNGFVFNAEDAIEMQRQTACDAVMVSRGAIGNPFIFSRYERLKKNENAPKPDVSEIYANVLEHIDKITVEYGRNITGLHNAKKHVIWYFKFSEGIDWLAPKALKARGCEELREIIEVHVEKIKNGVYPASDAKIVENKFKDRILFWLVKKTTGKVENKVWELNGKGNIN